MKFTYIGKCEIKKGFEYGQPDELVNSTNYITLKAKLLDLTMVKPHEAKTKLVNYEKKRYGLKGATNS